jgi:hypothetical protein
VEPISSIGRPPIQKLIPQPAAVANVHDVGDRPGSRVADRDRALPVMSVKYENQSAPIESCAIQIAAW